MTRQRLPSVPVTPHVAASERTRNAPALDMSLVIVCVVTIVGAGGPMWLLFTDTGNKFVLWVLKLIASFALNWPFLFIFLVLMLCAHGAALYTCAKANDPVVTREMGELMGWFPKS